MMRGDLMFTVTHCMASELLAIGYSYFISFMIRYIRSPDREVGRGI